MSKFKRLFKIIKDYFNLIFYKQKVKLIEETRTITGNTELEINNPEKNRKEENVFNSFVDNEKEKKDFFIVYNNVKKGVIKLEELMIDDLIKVQLMMMSEMDCIDEKIYISENEVNSLNNEISKFREENKKYYAKLQNNG